MSIRIIRLTYIICLYTVYIYIAMCNAMWYNDDTMKLYADFGKIANLPFFWLHHVSNLFRIYLSFFPGVEKTHRKAGTTELWLPGEAITWNRWSLIAGPLGNQDALGEVEISSLERALQSGLERLGGPEVSAARRPPLGSQNLNFCVNCCHLGIMIAWWKTLFLLHTGMRHVI